MPNPLMCAGHTRLHQHRRKAASSAIIACCSPIDLFVSPAGLPARPPAWQPAVWYVEVVAGHRRRTVRLLSRCSSCVGCASGSLETVTPLPCTRLGQIRPAWTCESCTGYARLPPSFPFMQRDPRVKRVSVAARRKAKGEGSGWGEEKG